MAKLGIIFFPMAFLTNFYSNLYPVKAVAQ